MNLCLAKVPPELAQRIQADPDLLEQLGLDGSADEDAPPPDPAVDPARDTLFEDCLGVSEQIGDDPGTYRWMRQALYGTGTEIDFDFGYGNGFTVTAAQAAEIADGLADEGWWQPGQQVTLISHAIAAFYRSAADEGRTVIGGIA